MEREQADRLVRSWFEAALRAVDPGVAVERAVLGMPTLLDGPPPVVLAIGKAAGAMTRGLLTTLTSGIARAVVITKQLGTVGDLPASVEVFEAGHPIPDDRSIRATRAALAMLERSSPEEPVIVLLSGGGSALFEAPVEGVGLSEIATLTGQMLRAGATINELNTVRSQLSRVKQGGLLRYIRGDHPTTLVLSDVIGNDLSVIASGPTVIPATRDDTRAILGRLGILTMIPPWILVLIDAREPPSANAPGAGNLRIVADNEVAIDAFASEARKHAKVTIAWRQKTGEARDLATQWVAACRTAPPDVDVLVGGGEATVIVRGDGVGGRNTEFAVAAALGLERLGNEDWVVASLATDGDDGPTGAAGGIASRDTIRLARAAGVDPVAALASNDTLCVLDAAGAAVRTGPTGTNVNDLYVAVRVR